MSGKASGRGAGRATLKKVLAHIGRYRWLVLASLALAALTVVLTLYVPILVGRAIDGIVAAGQVRFDIIAIVGSGTNVEIRHTKNAFNVMSF